jgi:hypothetical protein
MCVTSALMAWGQTRPLQEWTPLTFDYFKLLTEQAKYFDRIARQPDCEDPEKVLLLERIEAQLKGLNVRIDALEGLSTFITAVEAITSVEPATADAPAEEPDYVI